jgi:hypothetical protein
MSNTLRAISFLNGRPRGFRRGDWVQVRSLEEIQSMLAPGGKYEGLPFMPEMAKYCGRIFRVSRRADRIFLDRYCYVASLKNTVFLSDLRCDGKAHDNCQMGCQLFWKEAWLKPAAAPGKETSASPASELISLTLSTRKGDRFTCQATELVHATKRLPWWDLRQYANEVATGETSIGQLLASLLERVKGKLFRIFRREDNIVEGLLSQPTPTESLNLQPGEWVEVKSLREIKATLDVGGKNRGLGFAPDQAAFCGKRYRVAGRVEKLILEWSGEMHTIANTVKLEELTCRGRMCRSCPRNCLHLWREIWLRRVPGPK